MLMQKYFSFVAFILAASGVFAQRSIDSMVQAEKNFANTALVASTKEAFVKFIDTAGIVFEKGNPVNGFELYTKSERRPGILTWEPEYAEISSSNDFGYTTGPWKYYANTLKDDPLAKGHFITVWHLKNNGEWKFLIDFGINYNMERKKVALKKVTPGKDELKNGFQQSLKEAEEKFIQSYKAQGKRAYSFFLSSNSRLNYAGYLPALNSTERKALIDSLPANIGYTIVGFGSSPKNDLGYVYGTADINDKHEGYLRIWRREKDGWKIAVEVLRFK
jgi:ketosteroid isomerase-like protein